MSDAQPYKCVKCGTRFTLEQRYLQHNCKQMKREEALRDTIGQAAWLYYQKWMKAYSRAAPNADAFLHSRYFNSFIRFADFAKKTKIVDAESFISLMKAKDIDPTIWTNDQVYALYIEHLDKNLTPKQQAKITMETLFHLADDNDVDVSEVFDILTPNDVIQLLRERKVSPWILLNSPKFKQFVVHKTAGDHRVILESMIRPALWKQKFASDPDLVKQMKVYVSELKL